MLKHYTAILLRNIQRNALFIGFNVIGLAVALALATLSYFNYTTDTGYDSNHANRKSIYRISSVREFEGSETHFAIVPAPLREVIAQNISEINNSTRYAPSNSFFKVDNTIFNAGLAYVDPSFFSMFTFEMIGGSLTTEQEKGNVVLTDDMSLKLFNTVKSIGMPVTLLVGDKKKELVVSAVIKRSPLFSSFQATAYLNYKNHIDEFSEKEDNWKYRNSVFVQINEPYKVKQVEDQLQRFRVSNNSVRSDFQIKQFVLDPFSSMALHDSAKDTQQIMTRPAGPRSAVLGNTISAVLILLLACLNLTITSIAISSTRLKEIGIRKVMGSERKHLIGQFLGETFFIVCMAVILSLPLTEFFTKGWNSLWPWVKLEVHFLDPYFIAFSVLLAALATLLAGSYPAFYISRFQTAHVLKGKVKFGGTNYFMRSLLVLQFCIAVIGIVFAVAFVQNAKYQQSYDLGFHQSEVLFARMSTYGDYKTYRDALEQNKDILSMAGSKHHLLYSSRGHQPIKYQSKQIEIDLLEVGAGYRNAVGFTLLQGRDFVEDSETDRNESILITQTLANEFHWDNAIGKQIILNDTTQLTVIGVLKDVYTSGLWRKIEPMMLRLGAKESEVFFVAKVPSEKIQQIKADMENKWKRLFPDRLSSIVAMGEMEILTQTAVVNNNLVLMFSFIGIVSILLSSTGLFALVALNITKRMKEIGVRKVLGASIAQITMLINKEFFVILIISFIGGCVASFYLANGLMGAIWKYYQPTTLTTFVAAGCSLLVIAGGTILVKVYRAASINPVETLKDD